MSSRDILSEKLSDTRPSTATDTANESPGAKELPLDDQPREDITTIADTEHDGQYLQGLQLIPVIACVTLAAFLVLLDTSIIATVRRETSSHRDCLPEKD